MRVGSWSVCAGWAWHDEWVWGVVGRFAFIGLLYIVLGPWRVAVTFPVIVKADIDEDACTVPQASTPA